MVQLTQGDNIMQTGFPFDSDNDTQTSSFLSADQLRFLEMQNQCALCGNQLTIQVESYLEHNMLREEAHCSHCNVKARAKDHRMQ
jgi:hypothetical protein